MYILFYTPKLPKNAEECMPSPLNTHIPGNPKPNSRTERKKKD